MQIKYPFTDYKAIRLMAVLLKRIGPMDKLKLVKLLYFADRDCFLMHGHPITGDDLYAMPHGPVPSGCLDLLNGVQSSDIYRFIRIENNNVSLVAEPPSLDDEFVGDELGVIQETIREYGGKTAGQLWRLTHELPEYKRHNIAGTSNPISFNTLLEFYGGPRMFRHGRAVITREMRKHLPCPFPQFG